MNINCQIIDVSKTYKIMKKMFINGKKISIFIQFIKNNKTIFDTCGISIK